MRSTLLIRIIISSFFFFFNLKLLLLWLTPINLEGIKIHKKILTAHHCKNNFDEIIINFYFFFRKIQKLRGKFPRKMLLEISCHELLGHPIWLKEGIDQDFGKSNEILRSQFNVLIVLKRKDKSFYGYENWTTATKW